MRDADLTSRRRAWDRRETEVGDSVAADVFDGAEELPERSPEAANSTTDGGPESASQRISTHSHRQSLMLFGPHNVDLRDALNAVDDVVQNRPRPLREFDQIYMKSADMVLQSEIVARWASGKRLAFIGDGDAISVCVAYLQHRGVLGYGPVEIVVFDFDERIVNAVARFADKERMETLRSVLYNVLDPFPSVAEFDAFYTNPPWGASNDGESVTVFVQRGMEATGYGGDGMAVVADDPDLDWPKKVLRRLQQWSNDQGYFVAEMMPRLHRYHLDDAPELRSCNVVLSPAPGNRRTTRSQPIRGAKRMDNFYGRDKSPRVRYVRENTVLAYGKAHEDEYRFELLEPDE
jgi:N4-bis(aminopropyl)spermidine synthase